MSDTLNVEKREQTGSLRMKRLRQSGQIPAVLYGHGEDNVLLSVSAKELNKAIEHGSFVVNLKGAANESALIKDVQWDAFGSNIVHIDLTRVSADEKVEITLPIELKGDAEGAGRGGEVNFLVHQVRLLCPANNIPEKVTLDISGLGIDQSMSMADLNLPEGIGLDEDASTPVVTCTIKGGGGDAGDEDDSAAEEA